MTLTLHLSPELEQYLLQAAERQGLTVEAMALALLTKSLQLQQKQSEAIDVLQSWVDDEDAEDQKATGRYLIEVLDEDRLSDRKLFPLEMQGITW
jgi:hypothetical protein